VENYILPRVDIWLNAALEASMLRHVVGLGRVRSIHLSTSGKRRRVHCDFGEELHHICHYIIVTFGAFLSIFLIFLCVTGRFLAGKTVLSTTRFLHLLADRRSTEAAGMSANIRAASSDTDLTCTS